MFSVLFCFVLKTLFPFDWLCFLESMQSIEWTFLGPASLVRMAHNHLVACNANEKNEQF